MTTLKFKTYEKYKKQMLVGQAFYLKDGVVRKENGYLSKKY
jgi:hypothetical protein